MQEAKSFQFILAILLFFMFVFVACGSAPVKPTMPKTYPKAVLTMNKGIEWYEKGCYEKAIEFFWDAHEQFSALDMPSGVATSFNSIGNASHHLGQMEQAVLFLNQALRVYDHLKDYHHQTKVFADLAATKISAGDLNSAESYLNQGERLAENLNINVVSLDLTRGIWLAHQKKYDLARKKILSVMEQVESDDLSTGGTLNSALGHLELAAGNTKAAQEYFLAALDIDRKAGFFCGIAENLAELGRIYAAEKDLKKSLFYLERSVKVYALLGNDKEVAQLSAQIEKLAESTSQDVRLTLSLTKRWLEGEVHHQLCD